MASFPDTDLIRIGVSACLLGQKVRYDGDHRRNAFIMDVLGQYWELVPVCPETETGMPVPRETVDLYGDPEKPRMIASRTRTDWTGRMNRWSAERLGQLEELDLSGFIFKARSPSCGVFRVPVIRDSGRKYRRGRGLFAARFMRANPLLPVEEEGRLEDAGLREHFLERVFGYHRVAVQLRRRWRRQEMVDFHQRQKYLLQSHSRRHAEALDDLVAGIRSARPAGFRRQYLELTMAALAVRATRRRHLAVLRSIAGRLQGVVTKAEYQALQESIREFGRGEVPWQVPRILLWHYGRLHQVPGVAGQSYLEQRPGEMTLRCRV